MAEESAQVVNKPAFLCKVLIPIATKILIELSPASPVLPKSPTIEYLPLNGKIFSTRN